METAATAKSRYNHTAWFYEPLAAMYSCGKIGASKLHEVRYMQPGQRVLYAGVGCGEDAIEAARKGVQVSCLDLSAGMLAKVEAKFKRAGLSAEMICGDLLSHERPGYYDAVCANYFLNVFKPDVMAMVLDHLVGQIKPGGRLMVADFALPSGNLLQRAGQVLYYRIANVCYWILTRSDLHPIYNYASILPAHGVKVSEHVLHRLFPGGPRCFTTLIANKPA